MMTKYNVFFVLEVLRIAISTPVSQVAWQQLGDTPDKNMNFCYEVCRYWGSLCILPQVQKLNLRKL